MPAYQLRALLTCLDLNAARGEIRWGGSIKQLYMANMNVKMGELLHEKLPVFFE